MEINVNSLKGTHRQMLEQAKEKIWEQHKTLEAKIASKAAVQELTPYSFLVIQEDWVSFGLDRSYSEEQGVKDLNDVYQIMLDLPPSPYTKELKDGEVKFEGTVVELCLHNYEHRPTMSFKYKSVRGYTVWIDVPCHEISRTGFVQTYSVKKNPYSQARNPETLWGYRPVSRERSQAWGGSTSLTDYSIYLNIEQLGQIFKNVEKNV